LGTRDARQGAAGSWRNAMKKGDLQTVVCKIQWCLQQLLETLQRIFLLYFADPVVFAASAGDGLSGDF
jgi:hypothetical protein